MKTEKDIRDRIVIDVAYKMLVAAKTAPKGKGVDIIEAAVLTGDEIKKVSDQLYHMVKNEGVADYFGRDAGNLLKASALFLIGTRIEPLGVEPCGNCGFKNCAEKRKFADVPCSFNTTDLGIAIGSAVGVAIDNRIDNRVMYTAGIAAKRLGIFGEEVKVIYAIPLSSSSKNPFFDRN